MSAFVERASAYGVVGDYLLSLRSYFPDSFKGYGQTTFVNDLVRLQSSTPTLKTKHALLPAAVSLLALPFPLQVPLTLSDILVLAKRASGVPFDYVHSARWSDSPLISSEYRGRDYMVLCTNALFLRNCFPVKKHASAYSKVNVSLPDLAVSLCKLGHTRSLIGMIFRCAGLLHEDAFMNALIYGYALSYHFGASGWDIACHFILNPKIAKNVSVSLKALGANTTREGALLVEADTLQGRLAAPVDIDAQARYRCDPVAVAKSVIPYSDELRTHIRAILLDETRDRECVLPNLHSWWSARWLWCVNGSQTTKSSKDMGLDPKANRATHDQDFRRMASEALKSEPLTTWDGTTSVSKSIKLENGKERAIFACDTNSYFAFSWLLSSAEKVWRGKRVILDPGVGGHLGIAKRVQGAQRGGGVNLMLDYDDFNSQHATPVMQCVIDELCNIFSCPDWYRELLINSLDKMFINIDGAPQRVVGTLMSGHRGTTFFNSVLNAAYIRLAVGASAFDSLISLHAGDDVYIRCNTLSDCDSILNNTRRVGCRMNPSKQSIGFVGAEFLRVGIGTNAAYGYLARGIAGFVSGNWVTQDILAPDDALVSSISACRTLINRSGCASLALLLSRSLRYTSGFSHRVLRSLFSGESALEGSPVYNVDYQIRNYKMNRVTPDSIPVPSNWARHASIDYLTSHLSEIEVTAINMVGVDALNLLVTSSYSKGLNMKYRAALTRPTISRMTVRLARGFVSAATLLDKRLERGCLSQYPVVRLFENRLDHNSLRELITLAGGNPAARDLREEAFGRTSLSKNIIGYLPFGDAASLSKRTTAGNIFTLYNVYT
ncbi:RNA-dependent RNA polymerase [Sclerotinia nivalis victorivirus 1]|uniref:RNA-directed RNA polymerase n=1 Tax=Sclerotinia nivalis victorivirus 1 TaxID=1859161 RepID=A0A192AB53_9VIRU|nr:RNA-dependent RNA polymerase [Sclerotinia nivalis victorivirus 1]ANJ77668.1 RNA-dependent RNA polymerase [Sclerotinia nivalis victorivirus 1]